ncbi:MAG: putative metalloprotease CJM1_0395 family protein [Pseudomonadota bacterium]|nr:putative metalloprotease CJM1_0395 family protein [Pseudomonadota bacterium]
MNNSVQGLYSVGMAYASISRQGASVSPLNAEPAKLVQSNVIDKPNSLQSQSSRPIQYSNAIVSKQNESAINQMPVNGESKDGSSLSEQNNLTPDVAKQERQVRQVITQLKARDTEVRAHEMAHLSTAGGYARGGMSFTYQTGPDGKRYAIGGEVSIDTSVIAGDPEATLQKALVIQRAALAPAEPSVQDQKVAQSAMKMMAQARIEISMQALEEQNALSEESDNDSSDEKALSGNELSNPATISSQEENMSKVSLNQERQQFNLRMQLPMSDSIDG